MNEAVDVRCACVYVWFVRDVLVRVLEYNANVLTEVSDCPCPWVDLFYSCFIKNHTKSFQYRRRENKIGKVTIPTNGTTTHNTFHIMFRWILPRVLTTHHRERQGKGQGHGKRKGHTISTFTFSATCISLSQLDNMCQCLPSILTCRLVLSLFLVLITFSLASNKLNILTNADCCFFPNTRRDECNWHVASQSSKTGSVS
jgi:hypothetical protein